MPNQAPSSLSAGAIPLVLDASVVINLLATGVPEELIPLLMRPIVVEQRTLREVRRHPLDGSPGIDALQPLVRDKLLLIEAMDDAAVRTFLDLTGATPPDDLSDGEAATLALALHRGAAAVIDERKASRIARVRFGALMLFSTMDLLSHTPLLKHFGRTRLAEIVLSALVHGRMRVPRAFDDWVRSLLGPDRVALCTSLKQLSPRSPISHLT